MVGFGKVKKKQTNKVGSASFSPKPLKALYIFFMNQKAYAPYGKFFYCILEHFPPPLVTEFAFFFLMIFFKKKSL